MKAMLALPLPAVATRLPGTPGTVASPPGATGPVTQAHLAGNAVSAQLLSNSGFVFHRGAHPGFSTRYRNNTVLSKSKSCVQMNSAPAKSNPT